MDTLTQNQEIKIFNTPFELFQAAAQQFKQLANEKVKENGVFTVALSGGATPKSFYACLTSTAYFRENIPWDKIQFYFSDERYVLPDNIESNFHTANEYLFSKVPINPKNIYRMPTELSKASDVAIRYSDMIEALFAVSPKTIPRFDLCYLGLGEDAHTASLMPDTDIVKHYADHPKNDYALVESLFVSKLNQYRITFTPTLINHSDHIIFLVAGEKKAQAVLEVLQGKKNETLYPAQLIHSLRGHILWYLDKAAASKMKS